MMRRHAAVAALMACLAAGGCHRFSSRASHAGAGTGDDDSGLQVLGWVDRVEGRPRIGSSVNVVGWAASRRPECQIEKIEVLLDGMEIAETAEGVDRSDVADRYGIPAWNKSGWEAEVLLDKILPGEHIIAAVARDCSGVKHDLRGARPITVLESH